MCVIAQGFIEFKTFTCLYFGLLCRERRLINVSTKGFEAVSTVPINIKVLCHMTSFLLLEVGH